MFIPKLKKILYATDLSENARFAFGYAASLANQYQAEITVFHAMEKLPRSADILLESMVGVEQLDALKSKNLTDILDAASERLDTFCKDMESEMEACPFIIQEIVVKEGDPVREILDHTDRFDYDLIVMGAHGSGSLTDAMLGNTTRRIVRRSKTPVLVARMPEKD